MPSGTMSRLPGCIVGHHVQNSEMISLGMNGAILAYAASSSILAVAKTSDFVDEENPWPMHAFDFYSLPSLDNYRGLPYNNSRASFPSSSSSSSRWSSPGNYGITVVRVHPTKDYLCVGTASTGLYLCSASRPLLSSENRIPLEFTGEMIHSACFLTAGEEVEKDNENGTFPRRSSSASAFVSGNSIPSHTKKNSIEGYLVFSSSFTGGFQNRGSPHRLSLWSVAEGCIVWRCASEPFHSMCSFESNLSFAACSSDNLVQVYTVKKKDFSSLSSSKCQENKHEVREEEPGIKKRGVRSKEEDTEKSGETNDEENHLGQFFLLSLTCATSEVWGPRPTFVSCVTFPTTSSTGSTASCFHRRSSTSLACLPHFKVKKGEGDEVHDHEEEAIVKNETHNERGTEKEDSIDGSETGSANHNFFVALTSNGILVEYDRRSGAISKWMDCKDPQATAVSISKKYIIVCGSAVRYFNASNWEFRGIHSPLEKQSWSGDSLSSSSTSTSLSSVAVFCSLVLRDSSLSVVFLRSGHIFVFGVAESFTRGNERTVLDEAASGNHDGSSADKSGKESRILQFKQLYYYTPLVDSPLLGVQGATGGGGGGMNRDGESRGGGALSGSPRLSTSSMISSAPLQWVQPSLETEQSNGPQPLPCALWCSLGIRAIYSTNLYTVAQYPLRFNCGVFDAQRDALFAQCRQTNEIHVLDPYAMWEVRASVSVSFPLVSLAVSREGLMAGLGENHKVLFFTCKESISTFLLEDSKTCQSLSGSGLFHQLLFLGEKLYAVANTYLMNTSSKKEYHWKEPILQIVSVGRYHFLLLFSNYCEVFDPSDPDEHLTVLSLPFTAKAGVSMTVEPHYQQLVVIEQDGRLLVFDVEGTGAPLLFFDYSSRNPGLQIKLSAFFRSSREQSWRLLVADSEGVVSIYDLFPEKTSPLELHPPSSKSSSFMWRRPPLPPSMKIQSERFVFKRWSSEQSRIVSLTPPNEGEFCSAALCPRLSSSSSQNMSKEKVLHSSRLRTPRGAELTTTVSSSHAQPTPEECTSSSSQKERSGWKQSPIHGKADQEHPKQLPGAVSSSSVPCSKELSDRFSELTNFFHTQELRGASRSERIQGQKASSHMVSSSPACISFLTPEKEQITEWEEERKVEETKRPSEGENEKEKQKASSMERTKQPSFSVVSGAPPTKETKSSDVEIPPPPSLSSESKGRQDGRDRSTTPTTTLPYLLPPSTMDPCPCNTNECAHPHREEDEGPLCDTPPIADGVSDYPALTSSPSPALQKKKRSPSRWKWTKRKDNECDSEIGATREDKTNRGSGWSTTPVRGRGSDAEIPAVIMQGTSAASSSFTSHRVAEQQEEEKVPFLYAMRHEEIAPEASFSVDSPFTLPQNETGEENEEIAPRSPPDPFPPRSTTPLAFSAGGHHMTCSASFLDPTVAVRNCEEEKKSAQENSMQNFRSTSHPHLRQSIVELTDLLSGRERVAVLQKHPNEFMQLYESLSTTLQKSNANSVSTAFSGVVSANSRQEESWESQQLRSEMHRIQEQNNILVAQNHEILRVLQEAKSTK